MLLKEMGIDMPSNIWRRDTESVNLEIANDQIHELKYKKKSKNTAKKREAKRVVIE